MLKDIKNVQEQLSSESEAQQILVNAGVFQGVVVKKTTEWMGPHLATWGELADSVKKFVIDVKEFKQWDDDRMKEFS
eukprot:3047912-Pyramimonas_sp.AAC.1